VFDDLPGRREAAAGHCRTRAKCSRARIIAVPPARPRMGLGDIKSPTAVVEKIRDVIFSCRQIARLVGRRERIDSARLDTDRPSLCPRPGDGRRQQPSLRLSALAAVRLHSRHRVIGRRRLSEAPLARTVRSNDILQVADAAGEPVDAR
jgi:hypothetical protein